jgi:ElaB/YqjD/DUF883 family membrane-anchored ribosome-binding protein
MSSTYPPGLPESGSDQTLRGGAGYDAGDDANAGGFAAMDRKAAEYVGGVQDTGDASRYADGGNRLRGELTTLKSELDTLLEHVATLSEAELRDAYDRIAQRFTSARYAARGMAAQAGQQFNRGVDATNDYVRDKPLQAVGMAVGAGLLLGMLLNRR